MSATLKGNGPKVIATEKVIASLQAVSKSTADIMTLMLSIGVNWTIPFDNWYLMMNSRISAELTVRSALTAKMMAECSISNAIFCAT